MRRCLNNPFGYCDGEPEIDKEETLTSGEVVFKIAHCKLGHKTCGKYLRFTDMLKPVKNLGTGIRTNVTLSEDTKKKGKKGKKEAVSASQQKRLL